MGWYFICMCAIFVEECVLDIFCTSVEEYVLVYFKNSIEYVDAVHSVGTSEYEPLPEL